MTSRPGSLPGRGKRPRCCDLNQRASHQRTNTDLTIPQMLTHVIRLTSRSHGQTGAVILASAQPWGVEWSTPFHARQPTEPINAAEPGDRFRPGPVRLGGERYGDKAPVRVPQMPSKVWDVVWVRRLRDVDEKRAGGWWLSGEVVAARIVPRACGFHFTESLF